jgi:hypothetical protein
MKLKNDHRVRAIELRMGCGERLSLCQTRSLNDRASSPQEENTAPARRKGTAEHKR